MGLTGLLIGLGSTCVALQKIESSLAYDGKATDTPGLRV